MQKTPHPSVGVDLAVVVPTYKRGRSLARCLESLLASEGVSLQVIVVDQNPQGFLSAELGGVLDQVDYLHLSEPNCSAARNQGFIAARSEGVLFIDDDLVVPKLFCAQVHQALTRWGDVGCVAPVIHPHGASAESAVANYLSRMRESHAGDPSLRRIQETISACVAFRREAFVRSGGFDEALFRWARAAEDHELFVRMKRRGIRCWLKTDALVTHFEDELGGCELRVQSAERFREKRMKGVTYKALVHSKPGARWVDLYQLAYLLRQGVLNPRVLRGGPSHAVREAVRVFRLLREGQRVAAPARARCPDIRAVNHLARYGVTEPGPNG